MNKLIIQKVKAIHGLVFLLVFFTQLAFAQGDLKPEYLRCEYKVDPTGIDVLSPRLSWIVASEERNKKQSAYQIIVASSKENLDQDKGDLWDSGKTLSDATNQIAYKGEDLNSGQDCYWKVKLWDEADEPSAWSKPAYWSVGLIKFSDWKGEWISLDVGYNTKDKYKELYLPPARYLRKSFTLEKKVKSAKIYATAMGIYELEINGKRVGKSHFTPGWTDYNKRVYYNTYDVTEHLQEGENALGAIIADGWYSGYLGYALLVQLDRVRDFYGVNPAFMGQLEVEYEDGTKETIASDLTWKASEGPIREADILMGETYDARKELTGWSSPGFNDSNWKRPKLYTSPSGRLEAYPGVTVQKIEELKPLTIKEPAPGVFVADFGKNFAGIVRLKVKGPAGTKITLRYGEMLHEDGSIMTENLRKARATDTYILKGEGEEIWEPKFTYHGFQYVELSGYPGRPDADDITGIVMNSATPIASTFECSNSMNNQLYENILTTQFANFFEVPTDCPQRDERLGWTGDAQIYVRSSTYNADVAAFFNKWLVDLDDAQRWYGAYPNFAPFPYSRPNQYSPAWMDAGIIVPYEVYKAYNDKAILAKVYPGMKKFMDFQSDASEDYLRPGAGNNFGDWLAVGNKTSDDFIASVYFGYDARLMAEMAEALGKEKDAQQYRELFNNIKMAFVKKYINEDGTLLNETQTAYALAIHFGLYPKALAQNGADRLASMIRKNGNVFSTGFLGTKHVMLVLSEYGYSDLAYKIFTQTKYPSWGYSVTNGSTSIWERWNSYTIEDGFGGEQNAAMNSFSHYAYGSVAEWMFSKALGIESDGAGYRNIIIKPQIGAEMDYMKGSYNSINGEIKSSWKRKNNKLTMEVKIPANTTAKVYIPANNIDNVKENGKHLKKAAGINSIGMEGDRAVLHIGSGEYIFSSKMAEMVKSEL
jgi:alpha-L-rhamnosidase